jgi:hypothetical protein
MFKAGIITAPKLEASHWMKAPTKAKEGPPTVLVKSPGTWLAAAFLLASVRAMLPQTLGIECVEPETKKNDTVCGPKLLGTPRKSF